MARNYRQGLYKPKNPKKYAGDPTNIVYRSGWERIVFNYLDNHPNCVQWSSEEFFIPYISPLDGQPHRYFVDIKCILKDASGRQKTYVIEIKPWSQTVPPRPSKGKSKKTLMEEVTTYAVNEAKWDAAKEYCRQRDYEFMIFTEYEIGLKKR